MDIQIIALWIGLFITFVLGLVNFLWGPAILARREKVKMREPEMKASVVETLAGEPPHVNKIERIFIRSNFKLVRTRGQEDLYVESAYLQLDKVLCKQVDSYFRIPSNGRLYWSPSLTIDLDEDENRRLKMNKPGDFSIYGNFERMAAIKALEEELQQAKTDEELEAKQAKLNDLKNKVKRIESKFKFVWKDGKGKEWQYRLPEHWWNKFVPEWLWWTIA